MKKYLLGLAAVVVALSLSAFTLDYKKVEKVKGPGDLHWFVAPYGAGDYITTTTSVAERLDDSDCVENGNTECERAYADGALNNVSDPNDGVDPTKLTQIADQIFIRP